MLIILIGKKGVGKFSIMHKLMEEYGYQLFIMKGAGTQFDPEIAEAMLDLIKTEKIKLNYSDLLGQIGLAETLNTLYPDKEFYDAAD